MVAEHYSRAASLGAAADLEPGELEAIEIRALAALEAAGDALGLALLQLARRRATTRPRSRSSARSTMRRRRGSAEKLGDVALRLGRVDRAVAAWDQCHGVPPRARRTSPGSATCTARSAPASGRRATARARSSTTSAASTCSRTARRASSWSASTRRRPRSTCTPATTCSRSTPPRRRCGWPSGSARRPPRAAPTGSSAGCSAASATPSAPARTSSARSSWPARAIPAEAVRALLALGYHLEISEADYDGARRRLRRRARDSRSSTGDLPSQVELHAALAQLAAYRGDWEACERETDASQTLAEREGLTGKLCFPLLDARRAALARGRARRGGRAARRAVEIAEQVGRSEVAFESLHWLAAALRDRGDHADADQALARALDLCERAGLVAQSVEATAARAVNLALWGRTEAAREAAEEAAGLAERLRYPVGASRPGSRRAAPRPPTAALLAEAEAAWNELGRPRRSAAREPRSSWSAR